MLFIVFIVIAIIVGIAYIVTSHKHEDPKVQEAESPKEIKITGGGESIQYASSIVVPFGSKTPTHDYQSIGRAVRTTPEPMAHYIPETRINDDEGDFATSLLVAEMTDSAIIGAAAGGDIIGAIIGEEIADESSDSDAQPTREWNFGNDTDDQQDSSYQSNDSDYSSNDSSSSYDSSDSSSVSDYSSNDSSSSYESSNSSSGSDD